MIAGDALRRRALEVLGPLGDVLAREALEHGTIELERGVARWEGSHGTVEAHRVVLLLSPDLHARVTASPAAGDALAAALAGAIAQEEPDATLYDLRVRPGAKPPAPGAGPYR